MADVECGDPRTGAASADRQVEARRQPLAPRRRPQPGEVDDVGVAGQVAGARERADRLRRRSSESSRITSISGSSRRIASSWPCGAHAIVGILGCEHRVDDRLSASRCSGPRSISTCSRRTPRLPASGLLVADASRPRRACVASLLDRAQDGARCLVAPDALEPVGDLALPVAVDDHDQVQHPGGHQRLVLGVAAEQQPPQRRLDRVRVGVLLAPDVLAHSRRQTLPSSSRPSASAGPAEPDSYCGIGDGLVLVPGDPGSGR